VGISHPKYTLIFIIDWKGLINMTVNQNINVIITDDLYDKEDTYTQKIIDKGIKKLKDRLAQYKQNNIADIHSDLILIHYVIDGKYYVFKCCVNRVQIRLLYTYKNGDLTIISHQFKRRPGNDYIRYFEEVYG
jgi:hypothetical protein